MRFLVFEPLLIKEADLSDDPEANAKYLEVWQKLQENMQSGMVVRPLVATRTLVAAVVSLLVIGSFWFYFFAGEKETVISTAYNQIEKLTLADGSTVTLNGNSTLKYTGVSAAEREVRLDGAAFFEVAKDPDGRSFAVTTAEGVAVRVLGTKFNFKTKQN